MAGPEISLISLPGETPPVSPALAQVPYPEPPLPDGPARSAALDIRRSWIVEAPAGSGKTGLLIQRLLKLLGEAEIEAPGEVLAITFTRKAAQELRTRVLEQLTAASLGVAVPPGAGAFAHQTRALAEAVLRRNRERGWHLLESPGQLNIRTIDSFCGELARGMPVLAGGLGQRRPVEDAQPLYEEAAERVLRELGGRDAVLNDALRCLLLHRDARVADCIELIAGMLAAREQWGELLPLSARDLTEERLDGPIRRHLENTLELIIEEGLARAQAALPAGWLADLSGFASRMSQEPACGAAVSPVLPFAGQPAPPGDHAADLARWLILASLVLTGEGSPRASLGNKLLGFELPKSAKPELADLVARLRTADDHGAAASEALCYLRTLPSPTLSQEQWVVLKAAFHVLRRALVELEILFASKGVSDFTALSLMARQLLHPENDEATTARIPSLRLQHLLVDEMQDTSTGQYQLFDLLTRTWDGFSQTVFLVGDPKQSIYAFRQARVERFMRTQRSERLGEVPLTSLQLTSNFRSQADLVHAFNDTFAAILPAAAPTAASSEGLSLQAVEVPFTAAAPVRPATASPALHWHPRLADRASRVSAEPSQDLDAEDLEARLIRQQVEGFLARWTERVAAGAVARPPRIAVLARNRAHLAPILVEFQRLRQNRTLPYRAVEVELLKERSEVLDLLAITRALLHPGDRVAWFAVLRSPVCGLTLADLLALTGEGPQAESHATVARLVETRGHLLSAEGQRLLGRAWSILAVAAENLGRTALTTHIERTWRSLGADVLLGPSSLANARRFLLLLHQLEADNRLDLASLERALGRLYAEASDPEAVVELMTIHKSKGLEWDLVLVPALDRGTGGLDTELLRWFEFDAVGEGASPILLAPVSSKGEESTRLWKWLGKLKSGRELSEAKRLFYVACTRAREELHLYAAAGRSRAGELEQPRAGSLLHAAWPAAVSVFEAALAQTKPPAPAAEPPTGTPRAELISWPFSGVAGLALAAVAEPHPPSQAMPASIQRLPAGFDPLQRFTAGTAPRLPYPAAETLRRSAPFARPEGSFAARAFGNVVHRFLDILTRQLARGAPGLPATPAALAAELSAWAPRILQAFRQEGLPASLCERETSRALRALQATVLDATGFWLLSPHPVAWTERTLHVRPSPAVTAAMAIRADRVLLGGPEPCAAGSTHLWIVDFKTATQGGRSEKAFLEAERQKYSVQLQTYARAFLASGSRVHPVILALYYPLLTQMVHWPFLPESASD